MENQMCRIRPESRGPQGLLVTTVKSALLKVNTELFKNRVVSRTVLLEVVLLKDLLY